MTPQDRRTPQGSPRTWVGALALVAVLVASVGAASGGLALPTEVLGLSALAGLVLGLFATVYRCALHRGRCGL